MRYNTIVEKSEDSLNLIIEKAEEFEQDRVLTGLEGHHYAMEDVEMLLALVKEFHGKLHIEVMALLKFSQNFNKQYATDNNKCFDTAARLFNRIRSSIAGTRRIYKKFCPKKNRRGPIVDGVEKRPSIFTNSYLSSGTYTIPMFGLESYPDSVGNLCKEMESFFKDLVVGLKLCRDVMNQEKEIRGDYPRVMNIYQDCCKEAVSASRAVITMIQNTNVANDEMTNKKRNARSMQQFVSESFHTVDKANFQQHAIIDYLNKGKSNGLTEIETMLWSGNVNFVKNVRKAIENFDELLPVGQMDRRKGKHKLSSKYVAMLMKWCNITGTGKEKQFVEDYFNKTYQGEYLTVGSSSVNSAKNKFTQGEYNQFCLDMDEILKPQVKMAAEAPVMRVARNAM